MGIKKCIRAVAKQLESYAAGLLLNGRGDHVRQFNMLEEVRVRWWTQAQYEPYRNYWWMLWLLKQTRDPAGYVGPSKGDRRVVVYSPGHLGDILMTVPLMRALRSWDPGMHLIWVVGPWCKALASCYDYADEVEVFSPCWYQYRRGGNGPGLSEQKRWIKSHEAQGCDIFISTSPACLDTFVVGRTFQPRQWLGRYPDYPAFPVAEHQHLIQPDREVPEAKDLVRLLQPLGCPDQRSALEYEVHAEDREAAQRLLEDHDIARNASYVVISPGAGWPGKQWPMERWAKVIDFMCSKNVAVVLLGAGSEAGLTAHIQELTTSKPIDLAGRTSIPVMAALIEQAALWLGSDSGGMHLAAAVGTPTIALFGPTDPAKWAPEGERHRTIRAVTGCPDCIPWHPKAVCQHDGHCMKAIEVDQVLRALSRWFDDCQKTPRVSLIQDALG